MIASTFIFFCMPQEKEITAIILAGGKSSRMKQDKGLMPIQGKLMIEHIIEKVKEVTGSIIIITSDKAYLQFGLPCFADIFSGKGPLGGIYTGLLNSTSQKNLVLGCDTPFLSGHILAALRDRCDTEDALLTEHHGKAEPLCAVYSRSCIPHFRKALEDDILKITGALQGLKTVYISFDREAWMTKEIFANINTPEELNEYRNLNK